MDAKEAKEIIGAGFAWANWTEQQKEAFKLAYECINKVERYEKALNECIHQNGLMDFLDDNSWACQEDYFVEIGKKALYNK